MRAVYTRRRFKPAGEPGPVLAPYGKQEAKPKYYAEVCIDRNGRAFFVSEPRIYWPYEVEEI